MIARKQAKAGPARGGFTLLESLMALVIIGVGVLAFVDAQSAFHRSNTWSSQAATGMLLANEIREFSRQFPRHDPTTGLSLTMAGGSAQLEGWGREQGEVDVDDLDDLDDLDGVSFGISGTFAGPIDASGNIVPEIAINGDQRVDEDGAAVTLMGWTQRVTVEKVDPYNTTLVRADAYEQAATGSLPFVRVDRFPVRVTVVVEYQAPGQDRTEEITRLTWVVPK